MLQQRSKCCDIMVIRRLNFVMTMNFYVATLIEEYLKEECCDIILLCHDKDQANGSRVLSRQSNLCCDINS